MESMNTASGDITEVSGRDTPPHAPDGERGEGNPREPSPDPREEGDVLMPEIKEPNDKPVYPERAGEEQPPAPDEIPSPRKDGGHEADPPDPRKGPEEVPPYAGNRTGGAGKKTGGRSDTR